MEAVRVVGVGETEGEQGKNDKGRKSGKGEVGREREEGEREGERREEGEERRRKGERKERGRREGERKERGRGREGKRGRREGEKERRREGEMKERKSEKEIESKAKWKRGVVSFKSISLNVYTCTCVRKILTPNHYLTSASDSGVLRMSTVVCSNRRTSALLNPRLVAKTPHVVKEYRAHPLAKSSPRIRDCS